MDVRHSLLEDQIGNTPLIALGHVDAQNNRPRRNTVLGKLEGNNPGGSVKDRAALSMIRRAEQRGDIHPGDTLIEATSGNTGIALAMVAAIRGYKMLILMPEDSSVERIQTMKAFGADVLLTPKEGGMEYARDAATRLQQDPDGHPKLLHCWPVKLLQAGRGDYAGSEVMIRRAAASLSL